MSRKPLDLDKLENSLKKRKELAFDRETQRAMLMSKTLTDGSDKFIVKEEGLDEILIAKNVILPSDEEIEKMKQELKEKDKIEKVKTYEILPWWKKLLIKVGLGNGRSA